ncbi:MAG: hypothetical protein IJA72_00790, partial [Clostridia bacterium]|nr:hypothetical protein [Clostridia bacterium]
LTSDLKRGVYVPIEAQTYSDRGEANFDNSGNPVTSTLKLGLRNTGDIAIYCRLKLTAQYIDGEDTVDISNYIKLVLYTSSTYKEITANGWFKHTDGYYYLGTSATVLTSTGKGSYFPMADYIYLDPTSSTELYGKEVSVTLKVEAIQAQHGAHISDWGLPKPV